MVTYLRYVGGGFLPGVPARDLTEAEAKQYNVQELLHSGLYKRVQQPAAENKSVVRPSAEDK